MTRESVVYPGSGKALFLWLLLAGLLGVLAGIPWAAAVSGDPAVAWIEAGSSLLQLVPACAVGVWLGPKVGLGSGLRELVSGASGACHLARRGLMPGTLVGLTIGGVVVLGVSSMPDQARISWWESATVAESLLRSLCAGITEEITFRLGLMTLAAWVIWISLNRKATHTTVQWGGNLLAAFLFGAAHLPGQPDAAWVVPILVSIITVNGGGAILMGWLFMRYGLVAAIVAHTVADVLQTLALPW